MTRSRSARARCSPGRGDYDPAIEGHGTLTASNILGQGVVNGLAPCFADLAGRPGAQPCSGGGTYPGAVIGGAPKAKGAPFGDIYFSFEFSTQFGYLLATRHGIDVTSNSYGSSAADNDGYDAASQEADLLYNGTRTTPVFSTGNGAPGFGTATAPQPLAGIAVGASTQFGGTGWDSIKNESQITDNDVMVWSNRGPQATGGNGVDVVADGAFSPGDLTLNSALDGRVAWETWGGTSRSTPVTVAATALVYQAWRQSHGGTIPAELLHDREADREVVRAGPRLRELDPGQRLRGRGPGGPGRLRDGRVRRPRTTGAPATTAGRSTRSSPGRSLPDRATRRRSRSTGRGRGRSPTAT